MYFFVQTVPLVRAAETQTLILNPSFDTYISFEQQSLKPHTEPLVKISYRAAEGETKEEYTRTLMKFDLSTLPKNIAIQKAILKLHIKDSEGASSVPVFIKTLRDDWTATSSSWSNQPRSEDSGIFFSIPNNTGSNISKDIKEIVEKWQTQPRNNHGLMLVGVESGANFSRSFSSNEGTSPKPQLEIIYEEVDNQPPIITEIRTTDIASNQATITWKTDEPATSYINYGKTKSLGTTVGKDDLVTDHSVELPGLDPDREYFFSVKSEDAARNVATAEGSNFYTQAKIAETPQEEKPREQEVVATTVQEEDPPPQEPVATPQQSFPQTQSAERGQLSMQAAEGFDVGVRTSPLAIAKEHFLKYAPVVAIVGGLILLFKLSISGYLQSANTHPDILTHEFAQPTPSPSNPTPSPLSHFSPAPSAPIPNPTQTHQTEQSFDQSGFPPSPPVHKSTPIRSQIPHFAPPITPTSKIPIKTTPRTPHNSVHTPVTNPSIPVFGVVPPKPISGQKIPVKTNPTWSSEDKPPPSPPIKKIAISSLTKNRSS